MLFLLVNLLVFTAFQLTLCAWNKNSRKQQESRVVRSIDRTAEDYRSAVSPNVRTDGLTSRNTTNHTTEQVDPSSVACSSNFTPIVTASPKKGLNSDNSKTGSTTKPETRATTVNRTKDSGNKTTRSVKELSGAELRKARNYLAKVRRQKASKVKQKPGLGIENAISFDEEMLQQELLMEETAAEQAKEQAAIKNAKTQPLSAMSMPIKTGVEQLAAEKTQMTETRTVPMSDMRPLLTRTANSRVPSMQIPIRSQNIVVTAYSTQ